MHTAGASQGRQCARHTIQERCSALLTLFCRLPALADLGRVLHTHIAEDMRMASDELVHHRLDALGERLITVDCDVLEADGGTRTLSISGALIALVDAIQSVKALLPNPAAYPLRDSVAAISVGIVDGITRITIA